MAAPQIPNLRSLLSSRGGGRGRGRGRGGFDHAENGDSHEAHDKIVQKTDQDALYSRLSAVELGYLDDQFIKLFATEETPRRYPIINRGTYTRTAAIDQLVDRFLSIKPGEVKQIVSLGSGSDTRYFRLMQRDPSLNLVYHELDFPANNALKVAAIKRSPELLTQIGSRSPDLSGVRMAADNTALMSPTYNIHSVDLRDFAVKSDSGSAPTLPVLPNLSSTAPTLLLSECCLIYLSPQDADNILQNFATRLIPAPTPLALIIYEPIRPNDAFGRTMVSNLATRGLVLQTLKKYSSLTRQKERLRASGLKSGHCAADTDFIWEEWISEQEKERISALEMLDELEEWRLLAKHYCIAWGWRDGEGGASVFEEAWSAVNSQEDDDELG